MNSKVGVTIQEELLTKPQSMLAYYAFKRFMDIITSLFLLLLFSPILAIFCILIPIYSAGNPLFFQQRLGLNGKIFTVIKLRSMVLDAEKNGPQWAYKEDPRITKVGVFIRKTRIDEIPQLLMILKGDMSLIGPRPERAYFYKEIDKFLPNFKNRLLEKPGLTGWAQVNGGYDLTPEEKLALDLYYIKHKSLAMDIKILILTTLIIFTGNGAR